MTILLLWVLCLGFKSGTSNQDHYIIKEAATEQCSQCAKNLWGNQLECKETPLGFSWTCLKQHSRPSIPTQPIPRSTTGVWLWHPGMQLTSLETWFQHVWWDGNCPVEDPSQASSKEDPRHTEVTHTVAGSERGGRKKWKKDLKRRKMSNSLFWLRWQSKRQSGWQPEGSIMLQRQCSIWTTFPRWTNSTPKIQLFLFSSAHTHALGKKKPKQPKQRTKPPKKSNKAPQHFVRIQGWNYFKYSLLG